MKAILFIYYPIHLLIVGVAVPAIIEIIASAAYGIIAHLVAAAALLITEIIGDSQTDSTTMPSVLAELPEPLPPCCVTTGTAVQEVAHVKRERQLFVKESMSQSDIDRITVTRRSLSHYARRTVIC
jgi:hypothetical protein